MGNLRKHPKGPNLELYIGKLQLHRHLHQKQLLWQNKRYRIPHIQKKSTVTFSFHTPALLLFVLLPPPPRLMNHPGASWADLLQARLPSHALIYIEPTLSFHFAQRSLSAPMHDIAFQVQIGLLSSCLNIAKAQKSLLEKPSSKKSTATSQESNLARPVFRTTFMAPHYYTYIYRLPFLCYLLTLCAKCWLTS